MSDPEAYKQRVSGVFSRASSTYGRVGPTFFSTSGQRLVDFARIPPGARVLDVACGAGAVCLPASRAASSAGRVFAIDLAGGMVQRVREQIDLHGLANTTAVRMDAETLGFPAGCFDFVLCGLGLFFFPSLEGALAGFRRVLKPDGQLVASTFQAFEDATTQRWQELRQSLAEHLAPVPSAETTDLDSAAELGQVLARAGFSDIEIASHEETFYYRGEEEWWQTAWSHGHRFFLERLDEQLLARYKAEALQIVREQRTERGIPMTWHLLFARGRKPREAAGA